MENTLSLTARNQNGGEMSMLENKMNTTKDGNLNSGNISGNIKLDTPHDFVVDYRPTSSCVIRLYQGNKLASDTSPGQNRCVLIVGFGCILLVVVVYTFLYIISEKIKHKT